MSEDSPFFRRQSKAPKNEHGKRSEKRVAKKAGARLNANSGAMASLKGDATLTKGELKFLMECKSTVHDSMPVQLDWLVKISGEAIQKGKQPALTVSFVQADGTAKPGGDWVMLKLSDFEELLERAHVG